MIIEEWFGDDYYGNLVIENYPNLEKIVVKQNSLMNLNSLKICNNEKLIIILTKYELHYRDLLREDLFINCAFRNVKNVIIESI